MRLALHWQILIAMLIGAAVGLPLNALAEASVIDQSWPSTVATGGKAVGDLFLRLLQMIVVPLIFTSLVSGVTSVGNLRGLGRMGLRTFAYYIATSLLAILVGLFLVNLIEPGNGVDIARLQELIGEEKIEVPQLEKAPQTLPAVLWQLLLSLIPTNPVEALADALKPEGSMLAVIFFALVLGIFLTLLGSEAAKKLIDLFQAGFEVMMAMTHFIIRLAPIGVLGFMLFATAGSGLEIVAALARYMLTVFVGLVFHATVTLPLIQWLLARRSPWEHARAVSPALLTAFSTASSNGTLPLTMECVEKRAGISNRVSSFVLPLGATINMDGTALYEAVAALFIAQLISPDPLPLASQVIVAVTALLASIGAAGIPHAGIVMMVVVLNAVGLPTAYVPIILAVDRILDMCRTTVNVWSDTTAASVIARWEEG